MSEGDVHVIDPGDVRYQRQVFREQAGVCACAYVCVYMCINALLFLRM